jgi:hypothetical protein
MKAHTVSLAAGLAAALVFTGCNRQTRGSADANEQSRAASPSEAGGTSTAASAGQSKNFGDTAAKKEQDGSSPSASPTGVSQDTRETQTTRAQSPSPSPSQQTNPAPAGK